MKILGVSDRVVDFLYRENVRESFPGIKLLVSCGDLPFYYLEFLTSAMDAPLLFVRGNHDTGPQYTTDGRVLNGVQGGLDLHRGITRVNGLVFVGLEGSMRYKRDAPHMYSEPEMTRQAFQLLPALWWNRLRHGRGMDVLITHSPPWGIHDQPDLAHTGFRIFLTLIRLFRPRYLLHGHIHHYRPDQPAVSNFRQTTIINVYPYRVLDLNRPLAANVP